jgi:hypothetical protein
VFVSASFRASCRHLVISIQPAHLGSGAEKPHIERYFGSVASLFCQFASGYTGRNPDRRGRHVEDQPLWSMAELQEMLDEWLVAVFTDRRTRNPYSDLLLLISYMFTTWMAGCWLLGVSQRRSRCSLTCQNAWASESQAVWLGRFVPMPCVAVRQAGRRPGG